MDTEELEKARLNRERVARHENEDYYNLIDKTVKTTPFDKPLPLWIPTGNLPYISDEDFRISQQQLQDDYEFLLEH